MDVLNQYTFKPRIAYFSMEIALRPEIHTYSGGLGILAGDSLRSAADLELPLVYVTLVSRRGYIKQEFDTELNQVDVSDPWAPDEWATPLRAKIAVTIEGRDVWILPWLYVYKGVTEYEIPVLLLDTDLKENLEEDRKISDVLYGGDKKYRLKQELVLGIGGVRILRALGFEIRTYHLNEGHSSFLALELLRHYTAPVKSTKNSGLLNIDHVKNQCVFTTHTPIEAGHDRFPYDLYTSVASDHISVSDLKELAGQHELNMTCLALHLSGRVNGVSAQHKKIAKQQFPDFELNSITNGVHPPTWICPSFAELYSKYIPEWRHQPSILVRADQISSQEIWEAHISAKQRLAEYLHSHSDKLLDMNVFTIGFARRITSYKRPDLLFRNIQRLVQLSKQYAFQIVLSGKAHPKDQLGLELVRKLNDYINRLTSDIQITYIPNYDMEVAQYLIPGVDVWLNTPKPPMEASGTSGIKAAFNGVPHFSVLDGWWIEGHIEGVTGWSIDNYGNDDQDAVSLYSKLEKFILPMYYNREDEWINMMKSVISKNSRFNSHDMMRRYVAEAYVD